MSIHVSIYTDGSCIGNPGPGGYAALLIFEDGRRVLIKGGESYTTNNRMELTALVKALEYLEMSSRNVSYDIDIYTDSEYVRNGITTWIHSWMKNNWKTSDGRDVQNKDLWVKLIRLVRKYRVHIHWVKGHSGHPENEFVDTIARKLARKQVNRRSERN